MIKESKMKALVAIWMSLAFAVTFTAVAHADFGITAFGGASTLDGQFSRQAGAHADLTTLLRFPSKATISFGP